MNQTKRDTGSLIQVVANLCHFLIAMRSALQTLSTCLLMHNEESINTQRLKANSDGSMTHWSIYKGGEEIFFVK